MKAGGNTAQAGASSSASTPSNTPPKNVSKNQPPNKKHKTQQQTPEKRPWNKANLSSENNSSSEQPSSDPFMNKLDGILNALNSVSQRMTQLEDIRNTYRNPYDPISVDDEEDTQDKDTFFA